MAVVRRHDCPYNPPDFNFHRNAAQQNLIPFSSDLVRMLRKFGFHCFKFYKLIS